MYPNSHPVSCIHPRGPCNSLYPVARRISFSFLMIVSSEHIQSEASSSSLIRWFQKKELDHRLSLTLVRFTGRDLPLRTKAARPVFELLAHEARHLVNVKGQWSSTTCMQPVVVVLGKFPPDDTQGGRISKNE